MIDHAAAFAEALAADLGLDSSFSGRIFADELPEHVEYPSLLVRVVDITDATPPTRAWDSVELQVDVLGATGSYAELALLAQDVTNVLSVVGGAVDGGSIQTVDVLTRSFVPDDTFSPARPRWVLAVEATTRNT
jgi:hypothetical protein